MTEDSQQPFATLSIPVLHGKDEFSSSILKKLESLPRFVKEELMNIHGS
uniref:Uncharacterized protein n=1 Tax=Anopheles albimanus TaxID=7167 RepID=A0A182FZM5_ANOAL